MKKDIAVLVGEGFAKIMHIAKEVMTLVILIEGPLFMSRINVNCPSNSFVMKGKMEVELTVMDARLIFLPHTLQGTKVVI